MLKLRAELTSQKLSRTELIKMKAELTTQRSELAAQAALGTEAQVSAQAEAHIASQEEELQVCTDCSNHLQCCCHSHINHP